MGSTFTGTPVTSTPAGEANSFSTITLRVARLVTDVLDGTSTGGSATTLVDATRLTHQDDWWTRGTLWILSGTHKGKVVRVTDYATGTATFATLGSAIATGTRYAIIRGAYPLEQLIAGIRQALDETYIEQELALFDPAQVGDALNTIFPLSAGGAMLTKVVIEDPDDETHTYPAMHWEQDADQLIFASGYPPADRWLIHPYAKAEHPAFIETGDEISEQIRLDWLVWKAAEFVLYWGVGTYGEAAEYRITERLNRIMNKLKGTYPRKPLVIVKTGGAGGRW